MHEKYFYIEKITIYETKNKSSAISVEDLF